MATFTIAARNAALDAHNAQLLARISRESQVHVPTNTSSATAGGDTRALRGIPAIGPGVTGHIPGTHPHRDLT